MILNKGFEPAGLLVEDIIPIRHVKNSESVRHTVVVSEYNVGVVPRQDRGSSRTASVGYGRSRTVDGQTRVKLCDGQTVTS